MNKMLKRSTLLINVVFLTACGTVQQTTVTSQTGVTRQQKFSVSEQEMNAIAANEYKKMLNTARSAKALNNDAALAARVKRISNRLITQVPKLRPSAANWAWEVNVFDADELNAGCYPGGKIFVYSGLVNKLKLTDDELAQVIGHEISHALREHSREQYSREQNVGVGVAILDIAGQLAGYQGVGNVAGQAAELGLNLPFSREHETEADLVGIELAARAGYNPDAAASLWKKMMNTDGNGPPQFLSTHPSPTNRQATLQQAATQVQSLYDAARKK
ncbi:lipoprotein [Formosimonas limnophila]|uniref:Lipoprotein n=1 Tax=Formosimonas limnophila TaxID=1384487 RepID=A0A8J3FZA9_9BURK|nr:M48 family metallopeptidase [Formosimonas limnophila]GHA66937.1 lipoprotein [Formosimonas limnophila]